MNILNLFKSNKPSLEKTDVPKIVFTEIMRDVDMFVAVCSIGNDPNWQFDGDSGLSVIISKAFLLAEDDKIKDATILSQIHRR